MARDDFNPKTKDILAKRVGYICSNPSCKKNTIGPNSDPDKATSIGKAAHITAASTKGPRFDKNLDSIQRKSIANGIWLCSNCADLIDKDKDNFSVATLNNWKFSAENEMRVKINGGFKIESSVEIARPNLDIDLIWRFGGRWNNGYSPKNKSGYTDFPIIFWKLNWNFKLVVYNNSSLPIMNLKIEKEGNIEFEYLSELPRKNNLPPLQNIDLEARYTNHLESTYEKADQILLERIPTALEGLKLKLTYEDEKRKSFVDIFQMRNQELVRQDNVHH